MGYKGNKMKNKREQTRREQGYQIKLFNQIISACRILTQCEASEGAYDFLLQPRKATKSMNNVLKCLFVANRILSRF